LGEGDAAVTEGHATTDTEGFLFMARLLPQC